MTAIDQLINNQNVLQVTEYLMNLDTAMIEERYRKMGVRQLVKEQTRDASHSELPYQGTEEFPFFSPLNTDHQQRALKAFATQVAKLLTQEAREQLEHYVRLNTFIEKGK